MTVTINVRTSCTSLFLFTDFKEGGGERGRGREKEERDRDREREGERGAGRGREGEREGGRERERERERDLSFHLVMHSLVDSGQCPDWGSKLQPWSIRMTP